MKKTTTIQTTILAVAAVMAGSLMSHAQIVFQDQMNNGATWGTNSSSSDHVVTFNHDYSADGIPEAPSTQGGDDATRGVKLEANVANTVSAFFTLYPIGQNFTGSYQLRFDAWMNFIGSPSTTEFLGGGIGYNGLDADLTSGAQAIATGDGGSGTDWRAFDGDGNYLPLGNGNTEPYVSFLPATNGSIAGSPGHQWITWEFEVIGSEVIVTIEKPDLSRLQLTSFTPVASMDGNISLFYADFFSSLGDSNNFGIIDNVIVSNIVANVVTISAPSPDGSEFGPTPATYTFTRTITGSPLTIDYTIGGSAENGVDYNNQLGGGALSGSITFGASDSSTNLVVAIVDDSVSEPEEDIVLTLVDGVGYIASGSATATIEDNDTPLLILSADAASMYERHPTDYASVKVTRWGDLSVFISLDAANFSLAGGAVQNTDYVLNGGVFPQSLDTVDTVITNLVNPLDNSSYTGNKDIEVSLVAGVGFSVSNATATLTIIDDENPPATVLYTNALTSAADASNWKVTYANGDQPNLSDDGEAQFGYNLTTDASGGGVIASPPGGAINALRSAVNKTNASNAGINLYMTNASFSGDYAVRFNMNLITDIDPGFSTQGPTFGINHDGNQTNWWAGSGVSANSAVQEWASDGVWCWISADGGANAGDYILRTGAGGTLPNTGWTTPAVFYQDTFAKQFKGKGFGTTPPEPGPYSGIFGPGLVANDAPAFAGDTSTWSDVEIKQLGGVVTLSINKTPVFTYVNTTTFTSGYIMLGYLDPFSSLGQAPGSVYYANLSVVRLGPPVITDIARSGSDVTIDFTSNDGTDSAASFTLEGASVVTGPYTPVAGATVIQLTPGTYQAAGTSIADMQYYRISK